MKFIIAELALLVASGLGFVAGNPKPPQAPPAPTISADHRAEFFKRQLELARAQQALQAALNALILDCGQQFQVQVSPNDEPYCALIPAAPQKTEKK